MSWNKKILLNIFIAFSMLLASQMQNINLKGFIMKKTLIGLLAASVLLCTNGMAGEQTLGDDYCDITKTSDPYGFSPTLVVKASIPEVGLIAEPTIGSDKMWLLSEQGGDIFHYAIKVTHKPMLMATIGCSPMLMAEHTGDLRGEEILLMAYGRGSSIGGFGGAPMLETGVSDPYAV